MGFLTSFTNIFTRKKKSEESFKLQNVKQSKKSEAVPTPGLLSKTFSRSELRLSSQDLRQEKHARLKQIKKKLKRSLRKTHGVKISREGGGFTPLLSVSQSSLTSVQSGYCNCLCGPATSLTEGEVLSVESQCEATVNDDVIVEEVCLTLDAHIYMEKLQKKPAMRKVITKDKRSKMRNNRIKQMSSARVSSKLVNCRFGKAAKSAKVRLQLDCAKKSKKCYIDRHHQENRKTSKKVKTRFNSGVDQKAMTMMRQNQLRTYARRRTVKLKPTDHITTLIRRQMQHGSVRRPPPPSAPQHPRGETVPLGQDPLALDLHDEIDMRGGFLPEYTTEHIPSDMVDRSAENRGLPEISNSTLGYHGISEQRIHQAKKTAMKGRIMAFISREVDAFLNSHTSDYVAEQIMPEPDMMYGIEAGSSYSVRTRSSVQFVVDE